MQLILKQKPKNPTIIIGFPGFGLVGSIAEEFLISHLKTEKIGNILLTEMPAMVAIHQSKKMDAVSIYHEKENNLVFIHGIASPKGIEWELAAMIEKMAFSFKAKEIIALEGVGAPGGKGSLPVLFHSNDKKAQDTLAKGGAHPLEEGVVIGLSAALLSTTKLPMTCVFAQTPSELPDSKAAADLIKALDSYLGLNVDYKPLLVQAQRFEEKLKALISSGQKAQENEKKWMSYVG